MSGIAEVFIVGTLGNDPEVRYTAEGTAITSLSVATNRTVKGEQHTDWHRVTFFGKRGEVVGEYFKKGSTIGLTGVLTYNKYTDSNGIERTGVQIYGNSFTFVNGRPSTEAETEKLNKRVEDDDDIPF